MSANPEGTASRTEARDAAGTPWQLKMFSKTLKKQQKLALLRKQIGDTDGKRCLLITNGDNNGALNFHFRAGGGDWSWVENEEDNIAEMQELLGEGVKKGEPEAIPFDDESFDVVVTIDVHEHLQDCGDFNTELRRVTRPGGIAVVTTPNGDGYKPVTILKNAIGMGKENYGHVVVGYNVQQHSAMLSAVGFEPVSAGSYSKFFTEMLELAINFAYVKVLSKKSKTEVKQGTIAPSSEEQLESVKKQYKMYSLVYPFLLVISKLDLLLFFFTGYAVSVVVRRPT